VEVGILVGEADGTVVDEPNGTVGTTTLSVWAKATEFPTSKDILRLLNNKN
jgi:hypothetical protein